MASAVGIITAPGCEAVLYDELREQRLISSEFAELAKVCDRVLIVKDGQIVEQFVRDRESSLIEGNILQAVQ